MRALSSTWLMFLQVRQKCSQQSYQRQVGADLKYEFDPVLIGQSSKNSRADPAHAEGETKKQTGHQTDVARYELLRVHQDRRKRGRQNEADDRAEHREPEQIRVGQQKREWSNAQNRDPDHQLSAPSIPDRPTQKSSRCDRKQENKQMKLRGFDRHTKFAH